MPVTGLLLSLKPDQSRSSVVEEVLRQRPGVVVGERVDRWLPVAVEAEDDAACREIHDWIGGLPDVVFVDVVHVNFGDDAPATNTPAIS